VANAVWPSTLPQPGLDSLNFAPWKNAVRSEMDAGVPKMRRRFTAVGEDVQMIVYVTSAQRVTLDAFVKTTLKDVLPFDWYEFRAETQTPATYRFKSRPQYTPWGSEHWQAALNLDLLSLS
jgi:hypothetical protein